MICSSLQYSLLSTLNWCMEVFGPWHHTHLHSLQIRPTWRCRDKQADTHRDASEQLCRRTDMAAVCQCIFLEAESIKVAAWIQALRAFGRLFTWTPLHTNEHTHTHKHTEEYLSDWLDAWGPIYSGNQVYTEATQLTSISKQHTHTRGTENLVQN